MARNPAPQAPSIGRVVHVVLPTGTHRPAIVTSVGDISIGATVFLEHGDVPEHRGQQVLNFPSLAQDEKAEIPSSWHWPERVDPKPEPAEKPAAGE